MSTHDDGTIRIEGATESALSIDWAFDVEEGILNDAQYAAAVRVVEEPENADCERGTDCVTPRPTLIVGGEVKKTGPDYIGFHLAEDPDTGYERMAFRAFYVTADGIAICEECAAEAGDPA